MEAEGLVVEYEKAPGPPPPPRLGGGEPGKGMVPTGALIGDDAVDTCQGHLRGRRRIRTRRKRDEACDYLDSCGLKRYWKLRRCLQWAVQQRWSGTALERLIGHLGEGCPPCEGCPEVLGEGCPPCEGRPEVPSRTLSGTKRHDTKCQWCNGVARVACTHCRGQLCLRCVSWWYQLPWCNITCLEGGLEDDSVVLLPAPPPRTQLRLLFRDEGEVPALLAPSSAGDDAPRCKMCPSPSTTFCDMCNGALCPGCVRGVLDRGQVRTLCPCCLVVMVSDPQPLPNNASARIYSKKKGGPAGDGAADSPKV